MMAAHADTTTTARPARRADAGEVRVSQRDIDGLLLCGEHYGAPYDLLATALQFDPARLPAIVARWRRAGYAATGRLGPGPGWCWLTRAGMTETGLGFPATRPRWGGWRISARCWPPGCGCKPARSGRPGTPGGTPNDGSAPKSPRPGAGRMSRTPRFTGRPSTRARTPGRCGRSRWS